jgi:hypothetical protein
MAFGLILTSNRSATFTTAKNSSVDTSLLPSKKEKQKQENCSRNSKTLLEL